MAGYKRKLPPTGYWVFVCNRSQWRADDWLALNEPELLYKISKHNRFEFNVGEFGLLRANSRPGAAKALNDRARDPCILAVFEVIGQPRFVVETDTRHLVRPDEAKPAWRVPVRMIANLHHKPILAADLPNSAAFQYIHHPLQTSTIPMAREAFNDVIRRAGVSLGAQDAASDEAKWLGAKNPLNETPGGVAFLEDRYANAAPEVRRKLSRWIERGSVGLRVKNLRKGRCQICEVLGVSPVAFVDRNNVPYSEAHHIIPVATRERGALSHLNIMVLCPNHHRQAHYGVFEVTDNTSDCWRVSVDGISCVIQKTKILGDGSSLMREP